MTEILEKLLDVKVFFDTATVDGGDKGELPVNAPLLVTNCKASKLLESSVKPAFESFINYMGKGQTTDRIWFAILPAVKEKNSNSKKNNKAESIDIFGSLNDVNMSNDDDNNSDDCVTFTDAKILLDMMNKAKITTVFNFKAEKENGFANLTPSYIKNKKKELADLDYDHAVYSYPNFTLTRERKVKLNNDDKAVEIYIPGVYIDSAYPAAALLVASQQQDYLRSKKLNVLKDNVCTRVDLEEANIKKALLTKFNREISLRWSEDIKNTINDDKFGFVFCGDEVYINGKRLDNTYVHLARSLKKTANGYKPIYQTLMEDFLLTYWKVEADKSAKALKKLIADLEEEWSIEAKKEGSKNAANLMLKADESIEVVEKDGNVAVRFLFGQDESFIDELEFLNK